MIKATYLGENSWGIEDDLQDPACLCYTGRAGFEITGRIGGLLNGGNVLTVDNLYGDYETVGAACAFAAANAAPLSPFAEEFGIAIDLEKGGWWIIVSPGVYKEVPFTVPYNTHLVGLEGFDPHGGREDFPSSGNVAGPLLNFIAQQGTLITMESYADIHRMSIGYLGAHPFYQPLGMTGPVTVIEVVDDTNPTFTTLAGVSISMTLVDPVPHPVVWVDYLPSSGPAHGLELVDCHFLRFTNAVSANAEEVWVKAGGINAPGVKIVRSLFEVTSAPPVNVMEFSGGATVELTDCRFVGFGASTAVVDLTGSTTAVVRRTEFDGPMVFDGTSSFTDRSMGPEPASSDPGVEGEIRFGPGHVYRYSATAGAWERAVIAFAAF